MRKRVGGIFLVVCSLVAAGVVYADLKKGFYTPAKLGSLQQAAPIEHLPDSSYEASAYPAPTADPAPCDGGHDVPVYCNTCHSPRYITIQPPLPAATCEATANTMSTTF